MVRRTLPPIPGHRVELTPGRHGKCTARCYDCDFQGTYPSRAHARAVADEHTIHTHTTGTTPCGQTFCRGDAALKRKALRAP